jgi:ribosomal protein S18 acetylase RimI-like enzyme
MFNPVIDPAQFTLRAARADEYEFGLSLTRSNMLGYYRKHGLIWRNDLFRASWDRSENYIVEWAEIPIGVLRLDVEGEALHVRDIHIVSTHRNLGAGTFLLGRAREIGRARGLSLLRLRVFSDNPAAVLYRRAGFRTVGEERHLGPILRMECRLP